MVTRLIGYFDELKPQILYCNNVAFGYFSASYGSTLKVVYFAFVFWMTIQMKVITARNGTIKSLPVD